MNQRSPSAFKGGENAAMLQGHRQRVAAWGLGHQKALFFSFEYKTPSTRFR